MKKFFAVLMALVLVLSMGTVALAAGTGSITITKAIPEATYNAYQMLKFVPSSADGKSGVYTIADGWADFFTTETAKKYFTTLDDGTVALKEGVTAVDAELAKAAVEYAAGKTVAGTATAGKATGEDLTVVIENLPLGYYAVDTTAGSICSLTNTNSDVTAIEKNSIPTITKEVKEDKTGAWGEKNDADIDQKVEFKTTITVGTGAQNYVVHDTMSKGLTFNNDVAIEGFVKDTDYTVTTGCDCGCTFKIDFTKAADAKVAEATTIVVTYSATLNEEAIVAGEGNPNEVYLSYGDNLKTEEDETITYTWKMDVFKWREGDTEGDKLPLAGAKFQILNADKAVIKFTAVDGADVPTYKVDADGTVTEIETDVDGRFELIGLDEGTYYLRETEAPAGYNKITGDVTVTITSDLTKATFEVAPAPSGDKLTVEVENKTGSLLPETGGIGTTIFYVVGLALMLGAAILLITKKRMTAKAE